MVRYSMGFCKSKTLQTLRSVEHIQTPQKLHRNHEDFMYENQAGNQEACLNGFWKLHLCHHHPLFFDDWIHGSGMVNGVAS